MNGSARGLIRRDRPRSANANGRWDVIAVFLLLTVIVAGCASEAADGVARRTPDGADQGASTAPEIVGTWERVTTCAEVVTAFERAGLEKWILETIAGNRFVPGVTTVSQFDDPSKPCRGAVPRRHAHFFTEDDLFGSLDFDGNQVDDGFFEMTGPNSFAISKEFPKPVTFHFEVTGDTMRLEPVIPDCSPDCFEAAWSVVVAYPGEAWHRIEGGTP